MFLCFDFSTSNLRFSLRLKQSFDKFDEKIITKNVKKKQNMLEIIKMIRKEAWIAAQLSFRKIQKVTNPHNQFTQIITQIKKTIDWTDSLIFLSHITFHFDLSPSLVLLKTI